jgi:hypothetical protein
MKPYALVLALALTGCGGVGHAATVAVRPAALTAKAKTPADVVRAIKVSATAMVAYADKDHDGRLSAAEAAAVGYDQRVLGALDVDKDGFLTEAEITSDAAIAKVWLPMMRFMSSLFGGLDVNKDGAITRQELDSPNFKVTPTPWQPAPDAQIMDKAFAACDLDHGGGLDPEERTAFLAYMVEHGYKLNINVHAQKSSSAAP